MLSPHGGVHERDWVGMCVGLLLWSGGVEAKELSPRDIYEQASLAVVMVMGHSDSGKSGSGGIGSIIQADGLVLTNAHVVIEERTGKPYPRLSVFLKPSRVTGDTELISPDAPRESDGLLVAIGSGPAQAGRRASPLARRGLQRADAGPHRRSSRRHRPSGAGRMWTLTTGVISAEVDNFNGVKGKHVFQTETGLNRGNSGGPLLDSEGRMIAVNTAHCPRGARRPAHHQHQFLSEVECGGAMASRPGPDTVLSLRNRHPPSRPHRPKPGRIFRPIHLSSLRPNLLKRPNHRGCLKRPNRRPADRVVDPTRPSLRSRRPHQRPGKGRSGSRRDDFGNAYG